MSYKHTWYQSDGYPSTRCYSHSQLWRLDTGPG